MVLTDNAPEWVAKGLRAHVAAKGLKPRGSSVSCAWGSLGSQLVTLEVAVVHPDELGPSELRLWSSFQQRALLTRSPFLSATFVRAVGRARRDAQVAVVEVDHRIEAFLPFQRSGSLAMPIGWPANDLQGFVHSGAAFDAREVVRRARLRGWRFDHALADEAALSRYQYEGTRLDCPVIATDDFGAYLAGRSRRVRRVLGRVRADLEREVGPLSFEWHSTEPRDLATLIDWKSRRYEGSARLFGDHWATQLVEELATTVAADCTGVLSTLSAGSRLVAVELKLAGPQGVAGWFASYRSELARFSPGLMGLLLGVEAAVRQGITWFDLGYGQHDYKFRLATTSYPVAGGAVWASRAEELARALYRRLRTIGQASVTDEPGRSRAEAPDGAPHRRHP